MNAVIFCRYEKSSYHSKKSESPEIKQEIKENKKE